MIYLPLFQILSDWLKNLEIKTMTKKGPLNLGSVRDYVAWKAERRAKIKSEMIQAGLNTEDDHKAPSTRSNKPRKISNIATLFALVLATFGLTGQSHSLTLVNSGDEVVKVIVAEGETKSKILLNPETETMEICMEGCIIELSNGAQQEFEGDEVVDVDADSFMIVE